MLRTGLETSVSAERFVPARAVHATLAGLPTGAPWTLGVLPAVRPGTPVSRSGLDGACQQWIDGLVRMFRCEPNVLIADAPAWGASS